jgi:hypothetical protein
LTFIFLPEIRFQRFPQQISQFEEICQISGITPREYSLYKEVFKRKKKEISERFLKSTFYSSKIQKGLICAYLLINAWLDFFYLNE